MVREMVDVTVVIPALNREELIARALASVAAQTVSPRQTIVVDDGSTDATADVARALGVTVIRHDKPQGAGFARNDAMEMATTTWIAFLDSDDQWDPNHLELLLRSAGDHVMVGAPARTSDVGRTMGNSTGKSIVLRHSELLVPGDLVCISATMAHRDVLLATGGFRAIPQAEDLDMWIRVLEHGTGCITATPTVTYFVHEQQMSLDTSRMRAEVLRLFDTYSDRPWMTRRVRVGAETRIRWDDMRRAQATRSVAGVARHGGWLAAHPVTWRPLMTLLARRRLARKAGSAG